MFIHTPKKKKGENSNKIKNEKGEITTDTTEMKVHKRLLQTTTCQ